MKKKIGTLRGKPIVEGDSNLVKKTEIDISTIGNASTEEEYVYFFFPRKIFIINKNESTPVIISEQTEEVQNIINELYALYTTNSVFETIRYYYNTQYRKNDKGLFVMDNENPYIKAKMLLLKISKKIEVTEVTGSLDQYVTCYRVPYKTIFTDYGLTGDELDPYLISKEDWDKAVEETYKKYKQIIEL